MTRKSPLSDSELQSYAEEHVFYEIEMLFAAGNLIVSGSVDRRMQNAFIDSFVVHARTLKFFFYPTGVKPDDVIAADFFNDPLHWNATRPLESKTIKSILARANKELAHLTTKRISGSPSHKNWDANIITTELIPVIKKFIDGASPNRLATPTATKIRDLLIPAPPTAVSTPGNLIGITGLTRTSLIIP